MPVWPRRRAAERRRAAHWWRLVVRYRW